MSDDFFRDLGIPEPDINLEVGSGSHAEQTARIMMAFEPACLEHRPDWVIVVGDVNSTVACALTAKKLGIRVAHVEAGLRSRDMSMPEEINRLCTDAISDLLFTTDTMADENLRNEGVAAEKIHFVGNTMIDTLRQQIGRARELPLPDGLRRDSMPSSLCIARPTWTRRTVWFSILGAINAIADRIPVVFPVHPRTASRLNGIELHPRIRTVEPMSYLPFLGLVARSPHGSDRQRRHPGGDHRTGSPLPHDAPQHGTPDHVRDRNQHTGRNRPATHRAGSRFDSGWPHSPRSHPREVGRPRSGTHCGRPPHSTGGLVTGVRVIRPCSPCALVWSRMDSYSHCCNRRCRCLWQLNERSAGAALGVCHGALVTFEGRA